MHEYRDDIVFEPSSHAMERSQTITSVAASGVDKIQDHVMVSA
jgi:hypothetical protein